MTKVKDVIKKVSKDQFIIDDFLNNKTFAITESTTNDDKYKTLCIDFGNDTYRFVGLDFLILVLKEMYGSEYLIRAINEIKPYDEIKNINVE